MVSAIDLKTAVDEIRNRWPTVGLAFGIVRNGQLEAFHAEGLADIALRTPINEDTVFRVGSLTKTFTATAVMQLWEQGCVDLDAPANRYLRAFKLVPANPVFRPATVRHLLTHTAGIREMLHLTGLLQMRRVLGEAIPAGRRVPPLADVYRGSLRIDLDPGTSWMYTNHGFATLGQIVEDVTGEPLDRYFREHIFEPLGMDSSDLVRSELVERRLATGYELRSRGARPVDCELITPGAGGIYSSPRDLARYLAALLGGGASEHGSVLEPETVAMMYEPNYQPDPRIPGMGLAFWRADLGGHLAVEHAGIVPGFDSQIYLAPKDGVGVIAFANGAKQGMFWLVPEAARVLRRLLDVPEEANRGDVPQRPEIWADLCGFYRFLAPRTDAAKLAMGAGAQVLVRRGRLTLRVLSPIPALYGGSELRPDDPADPSAFRTEFPLFGGSTSRAVFSRDSAGRVDGLHLDVAPMSFHRRGRRT